MESGTEINWPEDTGMVYLGMSPWDGMWRNRHQLMSRFAKGLPVLYVEPPVRLRWFRRQLWRDVGQLARLRKPGVRHVRDGLFVFQGGPLYAVSHGATLASCTEKRWLHAVVQAARGIGIRKTILWLSLPEMRRAVGAFGEEVSIYHVVDEYEGYTGSKDNNRMRFRDMEQALLDSVDVTVVVSPELKASKSGDDRDVRIVENAVDIAGFSEARRRAIEPEDLRCLPKPRFGYSGLIGQRLNLRLLYDLAESEPESSVVLIGKVDPRNCEAELKRLENTDNVYFLGEKRPDQVPGYVAGLDVGLLPYAINTETRHISPLKMYEYLAVGIPVVSTAIPAARRKSDVVQIAASDDDFVAVCQRALTEDSDESVAARILEAEGNTWDDRVTRLSEIIREQLHIKADSTKTSELVREPLFK